MNKEYTGPVFPARDPEEEKKLFDARVDQDYKFLVKDFQRRSGRSPFPDKLRQDEVKKIEHLFTGAARLPRHRYLQELHDRHVNGAQPVYDRGHQDFETWIRVFVQMKFLKYLRDPGNEKQEPTAPVFALFLHYLMCGKVEPGYRSMREIEALCEKYSYAKSAKNIRNLLIATGTGNPNDPIGQERWARNPPFEKPPLRKRFGRKRPGKSLAPLATLLYNVFIINGLQFASPLQAPLQGQNGH